MRLRTLLPLCLLLCATLAPAARAATTIGDTTSSPSGPGVGPTIYVQTADGAASYGVPAGGAIVTSVAAINTQGVTVLIVRPAGAGSYTVVGAQEVTGPGSLARASSPARIAVAPGDRLAVFVPSSATIGGATDPVGTFAAYSSMTAPAAGSTFSSPFATGNIRLSISAVVEPDADHDGYGDDSQDACPSNPNTPVEPCGMIDLSAGAGAASPATITQGDVTTIVAPISANSLGPVPAATATLDVPAGLSVIAASTTGGECTGTTCALGDIAAGQTRKLYIVVRGTAPGAHALGVKAATSSADSDPNNNSASATVTVTAPAVTAPAVTLCTVPSLKAKTAAAATKALVTAGCAAGKATGSKAKNAKVNTQTIRAGAQVLAGTKVGFTLKAPAHKS
jgi:hypothetical protein